MIPSAGCARGYSYSPAENRPLETPAPFNGGEFGLCDVVDNLPLSKLPKAKSGLQLFLYFNDFHLTIFFTSSAGNAFEYGN